MAKKLAGLKRTTREYFCGVVFEKTLEKIAVISAQRRRKQGHADNREVALMRPVFPHFPRAQDNATRGQATGNSQEVLENALDWLVDGIALLGPDSDIVYANDALLALAERGDGFRIAGRTIEFVESNVRRRFRAALGAVGRAGKSPCDAGPTDFPVPRRDGLPAYIMSVRPLVCGRPHATQHAQAGIMVLICDPLSRSAAASQILQKLFSLTNAEAHLAEALCTGVTTGTYAVDRGVSLNTVYSHLKRIREKTGCKSVPELIRKFSELNVPLRLSGPPNSA